MFDKRENVSVLLSDDGRAIFLKQWQERKKVFITHPFLGEKIQWGLVPYIQALLLARYLRGDLDGYPPFLLVFFFKYRSKYICLCKRYKVVFFYCTFLLWLPTRGATYPVRFFRHLVARDSQMLVRRCLYCQLLFD